MIKYIVIIFVFFYILNLVDKRVTKLEENCIQTINIPHPKRNERYCIHPTAEKIFFSVSFNPGSFLYYLFPNSFKDLEDAHTFYNHFILAAKLEKEDPSLYTDSTYFNGTITINHLSGEVLYWNDKNKNSNIWMDFNFPAPKRIKNEYLKSEITEIYKNNFDHLQKIGIIGKYEDYKSFFNNPIVGNSVYFSPYKISWIDRNKFWDYSTDISFPLSSICKILRINAAYDLSKNEKKRLIKTFSKTHKKREYKYKLNFKESSAEFDNRFMYVYISTEYFYPPNIEDFSFGFKVKNTKF